MRYEDPKTLLHRVRHYRVRVDIGEIYYVLDTHKFCGFSKLIEHYSSAQKSHNIAVKVICLFKRLHYSILGTSVRNGKGLFELVLHRERRGTLLSSDGPVTAQLHPACQLSGARSAAPDDRPAGASLLRQLERRVPGLL